MKISGINGSGTGMPVNMPNDTDPESKEIQRQIQKKQEELQKLSEDTDMPPEAKMKKRQEIQQEIAALNIELRQHQIEQRKEKQNSKDQMDDLLGGNEQNVNPKAKNGQNTGLSAASMQSMLSADASMKQADVQGSVAQEFKGKARVLESEIKLDEARGGDTTRKREELAGVKDKIVDVTSKQMGTLKEADLAVKEAAEAEKADEGKKADNKNKDIDDIGGKKPEHGNSIDILVDDTLSVSDKDDSESGSNPSIDVRV